MQCDLPDVRKFITQIKENSVLRFLFNKTLKGQ